jgi:hypothetical protein
LFVCVLCVFCVFVRVYFFFYTSLSLFCFSSPLYIYLFRKNTHTQSLHSLLPGFRLYSWKPSASHCAIGSHRSTAVTMKLRRMSSALKSRRRLVWIRNGYGFFAASQSTCVVKIFCCFSCSVSSKSEIDHFWALPVPSQQGALIMRKLGELDPSHSSTSINDSHPDPLSRYENLLRLAEVHNPARLARCYRGGPEQDQSKLAALKKSAWGFLTLPQYVTHYFWSTAKPTAPGAGEKSALSAAL